MTNEPTGVPESIMTQNIYHYHQINVFPELQSQKLLPNNFIEYIYQQMKVRRRDSIMRAGISLKSFGRLLLVMEVIIIILFIIFTRMDTSDVVQDDPLWSQRYSAFQDVNVMIVVGFGFLMTFIKTYEWSALSYTFFINAIIVQTYILMKSFWYRVWHGFEHQGFYIKMGSVLLTEASYSVAATLISFGALIGRISPHALLIISWIQVAGYSLNELIVFQSIGAFDYGGSMTIHSYGAYYGLTVSLILSYKIKPISKPESSYISNIVAMVGTLFLWLFWPSFNFGAFAQTPFEQSMIVSNTLLSLTGSCVSTLVFSALLGHKFEMEDIMNATLAGGVVIGAPCAMLYLPGVALAIGAIAGAVSTVGFKFLSHWLNEKIGLNDSCGVHNLHGIPGLIGGLSSAIIVACYNSGYDPKVAANLGSNNLFASVHGTFLNQGGLQVAGTFTSIGMAIVFGIISGCIILTYYGDEDPLFFYDDTLYFNYEPIAAEPNEDSSKKIIAIRKDLAESNDLVLSNVDENLKGSDLRII